MSSCPHSVVRYKNDTVNLFGEETMPVDKWLCVVCGWEFFPKKQRWSERFAEWREVKRFARAIRKVKVPGES